MGSTNSVKSPESVYLGKTIGTTEAEPLVMAASPQTHVSSDDPPFYIQHGTADRNIPITQSANLANRLKAAIGDDKVIFEALPDAGHGGPAFGDSANLDKIVAFLDKHLK